MGFLVIHPINYESTVLLSGLAKAFQNVLIDHWTKALVFIRSCDTDKLHPKHVSFEPVARRQVQRLFAYGHDGSYKWILLHGLYERATGVAKVQVL